MSINITDFEEINNYFGDSNGLGACKESANKLLTETIAILDDFKIDYFLISGTLLGYVRHNDYIPWDDDIDLIVDKAFMDKKDDIIKKYFTEENASMIFTEFAQYIFKFSFKSEAKKFNRRGCVYNWPFIDLFIYDSTDTELIFFKNIWDKNKFYPYVETTFNNIKVKIPNDPNYFLSRNYGKDYMTILHSGNWSHKNEFYKRHKITTMEKYLDYLDHLDHLKHKNQK